MCVRQCLDVWGKQDETAQIPAPLEKAWSHNSCWKEATVVLRAPWRTRKENSLYGVSGHDHQWRSFCFISWGSNRQGTVAIHAGCSRHAICKTFQYVILLCEGYQNSFCSKPWFLKAMLDYCVQLFLRQLMGSGLACPFRMWATEAEGPSSKLPLLGQVI